MNCKGKSGPLTFLHFWEQKRKQAYIYNSKLKRSYELCSLGSATILFQIFIIILKVFDI